MIFFFGFQKVGHYTPTYLNEFSIFACQLDTMNVLKMMDIPSSINTMQTL